MTSVSVPFMLQIDIYVVDFVGRNKAGNLKSGAVAVADEINVSDDIGF